MSPFALFMVIGFAGPREIVVSPAGSDRNPGTAWQPLATLSAAIERARANGIHTIRVRAGKYRLKQSLALDQRDNGLLILGEGHGRSVLTGSIEVRQDLFSDMPDDAVDRIIDPSARTSIRTVSLSALGLSHIDPIKPRGFPHGVEPAPNELFQDGLPCVLARWPNTGFAKVGKVSEPGNGENDRDKPKRKPVFFAGDRAKLWSKAEDPWFYGYWKYDWADESVKASKIDPNSGEVTLDQPSVYGVAQGSPFFAENLLEELDAPGEYYIDRSGLYLYFIPRLGNGPFELSTLSTPLVTVNGASKITLRGLTLQVSRGDGALVQNCEDVRFEGCSFKSLGGRAVAVDGGHRNGLQSCDISETGEGGVSLNGGDRNSLKPAENFVDNCDIWNYERRSQTYRPAVSLAGVGNIVTHCAMHDAPHSAVIYSGNNHLIEYNDFYRTISLTGDGGVVYTGRDWTARGTKIDYNHFHDDVGQRKWEPAIYVDDLGSGIEMVGNLIERCHWGFLIGGGRDNKIDSNVLVDCDLAFDCDARGLGWAARSRPTMMERLNAVPYQSDVWRTAYPGLPDILNQDPMAPTGNVLTHNLLIKSGKVDQQMEGPFKKTVREFGNRENGLSSEIARFLRVPVKEMGIHPDRLRSLLR